MSDVNSSDIEISEQDSDRQRRGRKAIASIIEKSAADRIASKKKVKSSARSCQRSQYGHTPPVLV
jgi:hypothetical protein